MKLYLSSLGIPDTKAYLSLFGKKQDLKVAIIPTAWRTNPQKSPLENQRTTDLLTNIGITPSYLDLQDFGGKRDELAARLGVLDGVWVMGGNCFYLNYWMRESGFDKILPGLFDQDFVYGGESAGAVLAGKTLHGIELLDNTADAPETLWECLDLVDYSIMPHWGGNLFGDRLQQAYEEMRLFTPVKTLSDDQFISVS